jgi:hypothetical protein
MISTSVVMTYLSKCIASIGARRWENPTLTHSPRRTCRLSGAKRPEGKTGHDYSFILLGFLGTIGTAAVTGWDGTESAFRSWLVS